MLIPIVLYVCLIGALNAEIVAGPQGSSPTIVNSKPTKINDYANPTDEIEFVQYQGAFLRKDLVQLLFEQLDRQTLSAGCFDDLNDYRHSLQNGTSWAFKRRYLPDALKLSVNYNRVLPID